MCKSHSLVENVYPSRGFHFQVEKQTWCHLHIGATQTLPALLNQSAKGAECEAGSTPRQGSSSRRKKKKTAGHTAKGPRLPLASPRTLGPFCQSPVPGRSGDRLGFHLSLQIHSLLFHVLSLGVCHHWAPLVPRSFPQQPRLYLFILYNSLRFFDVDHFLSLY